jgi:hypothetical protein
MKVEVEVSKEAYELGLGLAKFHAVVKQAMADGWQTGTDIPPIIQSAIADLVPAMQGADQAGAEAKADKQQFANAIYLGLSPIAFSYIK